MGAWGTGSFENDDALDFVIRLEHEGMTAVSAALEDVTGLGTQDYLEAPEASSAIAAGEVVAAARDGDVSGLPEAARDWLDEHGDSLATSALLALARRAVERVLMQSELKELWEEGGAEGQSKEWAACVHGLIARLMAPAPTGEARGRKGPKAEKSTLEPGSVLRVDLDHHWHVYARILNRTKIAFHDCRVSAPEKDLLKIVKTSVLFVLAVGGRADKGHWPRVGHVPLEMAPVPIPEQFMQNIVTGACKIIDQSFNTRPARPEECIALERAAVWDPADVEDRIRDHYAGRPNAHLAYMKVRLSPGGE
jgi:hypothetical protein